MVQRKSGRGLTARKGIQMFTTEKIAELEQKGFRRWTRGSMDRMYINAANLGLVCTYHNTGSIKSACFAGYSISNSEAYRMKAAKTFVDVKT